MEIPSEDSVHCETLPDELELSRLFTNYRAALKATGYSSLSFQTPLQRLSRLSSLPKVNKKDRFPARLSLLPPGHNTVQSVDLILMLTLARGGYKIPLPLTLSVGTQVWLLMRSGMGSVKAVTVTDATKGLELFATKAKILGQNSSFAYKLKGQKSILLRSWSEVMHSFQQNAGENQRLQVFVRPGSQRPTTLRVKWSRDSHHLSYYSQDALPRRNSQTVSVLTAVPTLAAYPRHQSPFPSFTDDPNSILKRKSEPGIEIAMSDVVRLLNRIEKDKTVILVVCDFVQSASGWVLVSCPGYSVAPNPQLRTKIIAPKLPSLNMLCPPRYSKPSHPANHSFASMDESGLYRPSTPITRQAIPVHHKSTSDLTQHVSSELNHTVCCFDELRQRIKRTITPELCKLNFMSKYGNDISRDIITQIFSVFLKSKVYTSKCGQEFNIEEEKLKKCAFGRILRGDYDYSYQKTLKMIHKRHAILYEEFESIMKGIGEILARSEMSEKDVAVATKRFNYLGSFIALNK